MILQRILAIISAMLLVGSVALALLGPPAATLGQSLFLLDQDIVAGMQTWLALHLGGWIWDMLVLPFLQRPVWLGPASLGLICAGLALSVSSRKSTRRSHGRS